MPDRPTRAAAGFHGPAVRSDCRVEVALADTPQIVVRSKVGALYGDSIRELLHDGLRRLGAAELSVTIDDSGALPFVIQARLEAAVRRLYGHAGELLPQPVGRQGDGAGPPGGAARQAALRRSRLYLPGVSPRLFINAGLYSSDAIILDLEDAVPAAEKDAALPLVRNALRAVDFYGAELMVRVNRGRAGLDEIRALAPHGAQVFLLPKVESPDEVAAASALLDELEAAGRCAGIGLLPLVESARGVLAAGAIAAAPRVAAMAIGLEDYTADIGAVRTAGGRESLWAQSQVINAARAAGVQPLASVYSAIDDAEGLAAWCAEARGMGFEGAGCLHPRQIRVVHAAFAPTDAEVASARRVQEALTEAEARGSGVATVEGAMIDAPVAARARRVLRAAGEGGEPR